MVTRPLQCGTQWDGLGHWFYRTHMLERLRLPRGFVDGRAEVRNRKNQAKMVGRGVFLDVAARALGKEALDDG